MKLRTERAYALRGIPSDLWERVKDRATAEGHSIRFVVLALLKAYAEHGFKVVTVLNDEGSER